VLDVFAFQVILSTYSASGTTEDSADCLIAGSPVTGTPVALDAVRGGGGLFNFHP
jgi:hypothetical protein